MAYGWIGACLYAGRVQQRPRLCTELWYNMRIMAATELSKHVGKELKALRIKNNLTQTELAKKAGIFWNAYAKIEQGKQEPKLETLEKILKVLGVKSSDILPF